MSNIKPQELIKLENILLPSLKKYIKAGDSIVAGISGGPDSMFLLYLLKKLSAKIIVAHVNHQLRKEANSDETFVKTFAQTFVQTFVKECQENSQNKNSLANSIPHPAHFSTIIFESLKADIKSLSRKSKEGLEETGRKVRYNFFKKLATKHQSKFILTAHHADDNLETVILNFVRGASLQGLSGMKEKEEISTFRNRNLSLLRPLLNISKDQILAYLKFKKIPFCVDKSNSSTIYKRNFIRHKIIPLLKYLNPNIVSTISQNNVNLREINEFMKTSAENWLKTHSPEKSQLPGKIFKTLNPALQKSIILQIYRKLTGSVQNLKTINLKEILQLLDSNIGNKQKKIGKLTVRLKNNVIKFGKTFGKLSKT